MGLLKKVENNDRGMDITIYGTALILFLFISFCSMFDLWILTFAKEQVVAKLQTYSFAALASQLDYNDTDYSEYELLNDDEIISDFYTNEIMLGDIPALEDLETIFEDFPDLIDLILEQFEVNISTYYEESSGNDDYNDNDFDLESITVSVLLDDIEDLCYDFATTFLDNLEIII